MTLANDKLAKRIAKREWKKHGGMVVFSHDQNDNGRVLSLGDMTDIADEIGAVVHHLGFGCFIARMLDGAEAFSFNAGTGMTREKDGNVEVSFDAFRVPLTEYRGDVMRAVVRRASMYRRWRKKWSV